MSEQINTDQNEEKVGSTKMLLSMGTIGLLAGVLIVFTFEFTLPFIKANEAEFLQKSIFDVIPGAVTKSVFTINDKGEVIPIVNEEDAAYKIYPCYDQTDKLVGVALEARDQGFQDVIKIIYGYAPDKEAIVGMKVLQSTETPGLGDKIESDQGFLSNFVKLDVRLDKDKKELLTPIELVKAGKKTNDAQISAITGATISSKAIARMVSKSAEINIPLIAKNLEALQKEN